MLKRFRTWSQPFFLTHLHHWGLSNGTKAFQKQQKKTQYFMKTKNTKIKKTFLQTVCLCFFGSKQRETERHKLMGWFSTSSSPDAVELLVVVLNRQTKADHRSPLIFGFRTKTKRKPKKRSWGEMKEEDAVLLHNRRWVNPRQHESSA